MNASPRVKRRRVSFGLNSEPGKDVFIAGSFNNWNPRQKRLRDQANNGTYTATMLLSPGRYEYKFIVNDTWCVDPACPDWTTNEYGSLNSVITVE
jgi:1,4-alpha-glucan branching enzyme